MRPVPVRAQARASRGSAGLCAPGFSLNRPFPSARRGSIRPAPDPPRLPFPPASVARQPIDPPVFPGSSAGVGRGYFRPFLAGAGSGRLVGRRIVRPGRDGRFLRGPARAGGAQSFRGGALPADGGLLFRAACGGWKVLGPPSLLLMIGGGLGLAAGLAEVYEELSIAMRRPMAGSEFIGRLGVDFAGLRGPARVAGGRFCLGP